MKFRPKVDPTRTGLLRARFAAEITRRWVWLKKQVIHKVVTDNAFGLIENVGEFEFHSDPQKLKAFRAWLESQVERGILTTDHKGDPWTSQYIGSAYRQGLMKAYLEARPNLGNQKADFYEGSKAEFLKQSFSQPEMLSKVQLLATRSFEELRGVSDTMATQMNRELASGLANGLGPTEIARNMAQRIDGLSRSRAQLIARTEIIYAHAEGTLDSLHALGVKGVTAQVEFSTAGDGKVCPQCNLLNGKTYTIKQARGIIPVHPNCRCVWIPAGEEDEPDEEETKPKKKVKDKEDEEGFGEQVDTSEVETEEEPETNVRSDVSWGIRLNSWIEKKGQCDTCI